jgi:hypothetical protein
MTIIWGLDLKEMQWGKFKNNYMWNDEYHLRRTKFIVYQLAMIFCVVSESLGTAALDGKANSEILPRHISSPLRVAMILEPRLTLHSTDYVHQQRYVEGHTNPRSSIYNNDFVGVASYNVFVGVYVATIFGSAFFFDLFWPERIQSTAVKLAWRICSVLACLFTLASAIAFTVILATRCAYIKGPDVAGAQFAMQDYPRGGPLCYRKNPRGIASVALIWPGMLATIASTVLLWKSLAHIDKLGPKSRHARVRDGIAEDTDAEKRPLDTPIGSTVTADSGRHQNQPAVPALDGTRTMRPVPRSEGSPAATPERAVWSEKGVDTQPETSVVPKPA